jgi:hypothetical protein
VLLAPVPPCSARTLETRSQLRIIHCEADVKSWAWSQPSCAAVRPSHCPACGVASREPGKPLQIVGHGLRRRGLEGPQAPLAAPESTEVAVRRYRCRACKAILVVAPRGVARGYRYSLSAIAWALTLWGYQQLSAAAVRARTSTARYVGAAGATRWASLRRWTRRASALFGIAPSARTLRACAARVATFVASRAPIASGVVLSDAFYGAAFCHSL